MGFQIILALFIPLFYRILCFYARFILSAPCELQPLSMKNHLENLFWANPSAPAPACTRDPAPAPTPAMVLSSLLRVRPCLAAASLSTMAGPEFSPVPAGFSAWRGAACVGENLISLAPHALKVFGVDPAVPGKPWGTKTTRVLGKGDVSRVSQTAIADRS